MPKHELVKLAQWDDNRIKLSNFIAGYIIAHGLNYPTRLIDLEPEGYKDALPHNDVDIVLEADPEWAKPYADAGIIVVLKPLSSASPGYRGRGECLPVEARAGGRAIPRTV